MALLFWVVSPYNDVMKGTDSMKVVSVVGMTGSGKSKVAGIFRNHGFVTVRFGDVTDEEVRKQGLELNEKNERRVRETLREKYGMAAYAQLNLSRIDEAKKTSNVVVDGLYSLLQSPFDSFPERIYTSGGWQPCLRRNYTNLPSLPSESSAHCSSSG